MKTVFVAGVHGVGKSYLCNSFVNGKVIFESASSIIKSELKSPNWGVDKVVQHADANQIALRQGLEKIRANNLCKNILLDGHFVLKTPAGLQPISFEVFSGLNLDAIVLVSDSADAVKQRILSRDSLKVVDDLEEFMSLEEDRAKEFSQKIGLPFHLVQSGDTNKFNQILENIFFTGEI